MSMQLEYSTGRIIGRIVEPSVKKIGENTYEFYRGKVCVAIMSGYFHTNHETEEPTFVATTEDPWPNG